MQPEPQEGFEQSVEEARAWMRAVQERLQLSDNTQGPRAALEARLHETEKICQLEPEGRVKVDLVLRAAKVLLAGCSELQRPEVLARLGDIKAQWEDTVTYMTHCHSRIEWVWLHWSEYLLAREDFCTWFQRTLAALEPPAELQLGLREKQWQLSHARVLRAHVDGRGELLGRLLDEAAALFTRIGDPSVDEAEQGRMRAQYDAVKAKAQIRVTELEEVARDHEGFQAGVDQFRAWLTVLRGRLEGCLAPGSSQSTQHRLSELQAVAQEVPRGEATLRGLEEQAQGVARNTSPLGAQKIAQELEEMREALEKLQARGQEEQAHLREQLEAEGAWEQRRRRLEAELGDFRARLGALAEGAPQTAPAKGATEEELVVHWRRCLATWEALASEDSRVDRLQAQLKELLAFPHDVQPLSDAVVGAMQEYQSLKGQSARQRSAAGVRLGQRWRRPLQDLRLWAELAQHFLDVTASLPDLGAAHTFLPQIQAALVESSHLKEQLTALQLKADLLGGVFGPQQAEGFLEEVAREARERDLVHNSLLQRKSKLQSLLAQHKDFEAAWESLQTKLSDLQARTQAEDLLQTGLAGKQMQLSRAQGLQEEGLDLGQQVEALRPLVGGNPGHQHKMDQLAADCRALQRSLESRVEASLQAVREHQAFRRRLQELGQWVASVSGKLESQRGDPETREEAEGLLAGVPERRVQLALLEVQAEALEQTCPPDDARQLREELRRLQAAWRGLCSAANMEQTPGTDVDARKKTAFTNNIPKGGFVITPEDPHPRQRQGASRLQLQGEGGRGGGGGGGEEDASRLLGAFEQWLQEEEAMLVRIIDAKAVTASGLRTRARRLQELEARVPKGQRLFQKLLSTGPARLGSEKLEGLRYRWMLYKAKLKDCARLLAESSPGEPAGSQKPPRRRRGPGTFWRRVCCVALPLQLLLLLLLLLMLLLPAGHRARSCALANTFASSFRLALHHHGPPPT